MLEADMMSVEGQVNEQTNKRPNPNSGTLSYMHPNLALTSPYPSALRLIDRATSHPRLTI